MSLFDEFILRIRRKLLVRTFLPFVLIIPVPLILLYVSFLGRKTGVISATAFSVLVLIFLLSVVLICYLAYRRYLAVTRKKVYELIDSEPASEGRFSSIIALEEADSGEESRAIRSYIEVQAQKSISRLQPERISFPPLYPLLLSLLVLIIITGSAVYTGKRTALMQQVYSYENAELISKLEKAILSDKNLSSEAREAGKNLLSTLQYQSLHSPDTGEAIKKVEESLMKQRESKRTEDSDEEDPDNKRDKEQNQDRKKTEQQKEQDQQQKDTQQEGSEQQKSSDSRKEKRPEKDGFEDENRKHEEKTPREGGTEKSEETSPERKEQEGNEKDSPDKTEENESSSGQDEYGDKKESDTDNRKKDHESSGDESGDKKENGEGGDGEGGEGDEGEGMQQGADGSSSDTGGESSGEKGDDNTGSPQDSSQTSGDSTSGDNEGEGKDGEETSDEESGEGDMGEGSGEQKKLEDVISEMKEKRGEEGDDGEVERSSHDSQPDTSNESESGGGEKKEKDSSSESDEKGSADEDGDAGESDRDSGGTDTSDSNQQGFPETDTDPAPPPGRQEKPEEISAEELEEFGDIESRELPEGGEEPLSLDGMEYEDVKIESDRLAEGGEGVVVDSVEQESTSASSTMQIESGRFRKPQLEQTSEEQPVPLEYEKLLR